MDGSTVLTVQGTTVTVESYSSSITALDFVVFSAIVDPSARRSYEATTVNEQTAVQSSTVLFCTEFARGEGIVWRQMAQDDITTHASS